jgi:hypothetical protein
LASWGWVDEPPDSRSADHGLAGHSFGWPFCQRLRARSSVRTAAEAAAQVAHLLEYLARFIHQAIDATSEFGLVLGHHELLVLASCG